MIASKPGVLQDLTMDAGIQKLMVRRDKWYGDAVEYWKVMLSKDQPQSVSIADAV